MTALQNEIFTTWNDLPGDSQAPIDHWMRPYEADQDPLDHQFVCFLKPELVRKDLGVNLKSALDIMFGSFKEWDVEIGAVRFLNGPYLDEHDMMSQHYGVLNQISRFGRKAMSRSAEKQMLKHFAPQIEAGAPVLGGHQFRDRFDEISEMGLTVISDNLTPTKLAGGTYAIRINVLGEDVLILNAFHPYQLRPYLLPANVMIVMEGRSKKPWAELRRKLVGSTHPARAESGSIRNQLLVQKEELGMADVSAGANGIHLSAGPLEGMVELPRFFGGDDFDYAKTAFGKLLAKHGASTEIVDALAKNPELNFMGKVELAFDLTEELNANSAAERLISGITEQEE